MVPSNVECLADHISPDANIHDTVIHFKEKDDDSGLLLSVPIKTPDSAIVVTLGTNSSHLNNYVLRVKFGIYDSHGDNALQSLMSQRTSSVLPVMQLEQLDIIHKSVRELKHLLLSNVEVAIGPVTGRGSRGYWSRSRGIREIYGNRP